MQRRDIAPFMPLRDLSARMGSGILGLTIALQAGTPMPRISGLAILALGAFRYGPFLHLRPLNERRAHAQAPYQLSTTLMWIAGLGLVVLVRQTASIDQVDLANAALAAFSAMQITHAFSQSTYAVAARLSRQDHPSLRRVWTFIAGAADLAPLVVVTTPLLQSLTLHQGISLGATFFGTTYYTTRMAPTTWFRANLHLDNPMGTLGLTAILGLLAELAAHLEVSPYITPLITLALVALWSVTATSLVMVGRETWLERDHLFTTWLQGMCQQLFLETPIPNRN